MWDAIALIRQGCCDHDICGCGMCPGSPRLIYTNVQGKNCVIMWLNSLNGSRSTRKCYSVFLARCVSRWAAKTVMASSGPQDSGEEEAVDVHLEWQDTAGSQSCQLCVASTTTLADFKAHCARMLQVELVHCPDFNDEMDTQQLCELGIGLSGFQQQRFRFRSVCLQLCIRRQVQTARC